MSSQRLNPVAWTEGMFLRPHHLQQQGLFYDSSLFYHLRSINPFHWGIRELAINEDALSDHRIEVVRLDAVLPGGTIVRFPGSAVLEPREFDPSLERIGVHLAIRNVSPIDPNSATDGNGARDVRWLIRSEDLPDLHRGGFNTSIDLVYPNARLLISGEEKELELYESFKLAEVRATGESKRPFVVAEDYCPPLLTLQAFAPLFEEVNKMAARLAAKVRVVAGRTSSFAIADLPNLWMRYTLARSSVVLRHLLSTGATNPFDMYTMLVEAAGSLSAFIRTEAAELPLYDHEDLRTCYRELMAFVDEALERVAPQNFQRLEMPYDSANKWYSTRALNVQLVDPRNRYYLEIKADMDAKELASFVSQHGKASSPTGVRPLVVVARPGLRIEHLAAAPTEIDYRGGYEYFKVDPHGPQWSKVRDEFAFALNLGKLEHADVRLCIVLGEQ